MDNFEKVEKLREKAGVSYEEAKAALEQCNYDLLDAMIYLEKQGKVQNREPVRNLVVAEQPKSAFEQAQESYESSCRKSGLGETLDRFFAGAGKVLKRSWEIKFEVDKQEKRVLCVPLLILVLGVLFAFWITLPLLIVGLFCNCKYHFDGVDQVSFNANEAMSKASKAAEEVKQSFRSGT